MSSTLPSVLWHCWLGSRKSIWPSGVTRLQWARVQVFQKGPLFPKKTFKNSIGQILGPPQRWARVHCTPCTPYCYATDLACKKWVTGCWCGYLYGSKCKWFAYCPADATATPSSLASLTHRIVLPFWYWLTHAVLKMVVVSLCYPKAYA